MSSIFEDITVIWNDERLVIPSTKVMKAIQRIEEHITLKELHDYTKKDSVPLGKIAAAYASVIRLAGKDVTDDEVYAGMFAGATSSERMAQSISGLLAMMIPPEAIKAGRKLMREGGAEEDLGKSQPVAAPSLKTPSKQRSGIGASSQASSGNSTQRNSIGSRKRASR